jgi:phosphohistidine phosphatase
VRVFLVRHAQAAPGDPDDLRRLTSHGRDQAKKLGRRLARDGVLADVVLSSPLLRARETADAIAKELGVQAEPDDRLAPGCTPEVLREAVRGRGETVITVGHQPDCGRIGAALSGGPEPPFPAAGVFEVEL